MTKSTPQEEVTTTNTTTSTETPSLEDRRAALTRGYENLRSYVAYPEFHRLILNSLNAQREALEAEEAAARPPASAQPQGEAEEETRRPWWFNQYNPWDDYYDVNATW